MADVRPGEGPVVAGIAAAFAALELGRGFGEVGAQTLLLARFDAGILAWLQLPLGVLSMVVAIGFGAALGRIARARLLAGTLVVVGVILIVEAAVLTMAPGLVVVGWLTVMVAGALAMTISWAVAGASLDARQAKRLFPLCVAAAIAGAFAGNLLAGRVTSLVGAAPLLLIEGLAFVVAALVIRWLAGVARGSGWSAAAADRDGGTPTPSFVAELRVGFDEVRASPLFQRIALAYVLFSILGFLVQFRFAGAARAGAAGDDAALAGILGTVQAAVMATSFVVSLLFANRFYARFGVAAGGLLLPLVYLGGFAVWIARFSFPTAAAVTIVQQVTQRGISNTAWGAFYNVVPAARRGQVLAFMDGVPSQVGVLLAGVLTLTAGSVMAPEQVPWIGLAVAGACTVVAISIRRRYVEALVRTLRSGIAEQVLEGGPGVVVGVMTPEIRSALTAALLAPEVGTRSFAAALLARSDDAATRAPVATVLDDPDPGVRGLAVEGALAGAGHDAAAERVLAALLDGDVSERTVGLVTLHRLGRELPHDRLRAFMIDPDPAVRAASLVLAGARRDDAATTARLVEALDDAEPLVRRAASASLAARPDLAEGVLDRLHATDVETRHAALLALEGHGDAVRPVVQRWADTQVDRALDLARARDAIAADPAIVSHEVGALLRDTLDQRVAFQQDLSLAALTVLGEPAAHGVIRRCLAAPDPDVRAQAIEALDSLRDRRLGAAIARLVEDAGGTTAGGSTAGGARTGEAAAGGATAATTLTRLRDDADPWIARLAHLVAADGDRPVASDDVLADLDTMLRLRRVPLFERLTVEDLQRVARVAIERRYDEGATLIREGDPGDELFVILDGRVVVSRRTDDGGERTLRTYQAGDHIGELAVLRQRPRVATVRAEGGPVTTLVLEGAGLRAILRERPDAAMAMLATLAERISVQ